jgi:2-polyprenyl-3-methyl-5-hydroxy-6-metoxy-1,4-benzoquinol methylase
MTFDQMMETTRAFQASRVLLTAIELDLFSAVGNGATDQEIATRIGCNVRSTAMLLNAAVALGVLQKSGDRYENLPDIARYLVRGSPDYVQPALMHTVNVWNTWSTLTAAVRSGTAVITPGIEGKDESWTSAFISAMHMNASVAARIVADAAGSDSARSMLDVGGGSGAYSIAFARANPGLTATVFDMAHVVPITQKYIGEAGLQDRVRTAIGDLNTDEFGGPYDLILVSSICHMLDEPANLDLLGRCFRATSPGGRIIVRDFILNEDRTSPPRAALFALNMLVGTRGGSTYTEGEYRGWLESAGYGDVTRLGSDSDLIVGHRNR